MPQTLPLIALLTPPLLQVIRMLVAVVVLFLLAMAPIKILMTVITYSPEWLINDSQSSDLYVWSYFLCHYMAMSNR